MKLEFGVTQGHRKWHYMIEHIRLYICMPLSSTLSWYSGILVENCYPPLVGVKPSHLHNDPWWQKTRMMGLSDGERISMIRSAVLIQYMYMTDGRTDRRNCHGIIIIIIIIITILLAYFCTMKKLNRYLYNRKWYFCNCNCVYFCTGCKCAVWFLRNSIVTCISHVHFCNMLHLSLSYFSNSLHLLHKYQCYISTLG